MVDVRGQLAEDDTQWQDEQIKRRRIFISSKQAKARLVGRWGKAYRVGGMRVLCTQSTMFSLIAGTSDALRSTSGSFSRVL